MHMDAPRCTCLTCETRRALQRPFPYVFHLDVVADTRLATFVNLAEDFSEIHLVHLDRLLPPQARESVPATAETPTLLYRCRDDLLYPSLAPNGRTVCFTRLGSRQGLHIVDASCPGRTRRLTGGLDVYPAWTVDGSVITFYRLEPHVQPRLLRVPANLHNDRQG